MASLITHPLVPVVLAAAAGSKHVPWRLLLVGIVLSLLPDLDVIAFRLGVPYADPFGHRGFTHSLVAALVVAASLAPFARFLQARAAATFAFLFLAMASHGVLDACTRQGLGVAFFWPFSDTRHFFAFRPVEASPVSVSRFFEQRAGDVLESELLWLWLPLAGVGLAGYALRKVMALAADVEALRQRARPAGSIR
jgi:inner membrane protein